ncbi:MAG: helix-turn-helix transcriptional regulator [Planctomycetota bacterium]
MIRNEREYQRTLASIEDEAERLEAERQRLQDDGFSSAEIKRLLEPRVSFRDQKKEEAETYERLCRGEVAEVQGFEGTGRLLIALRIARGLSQRQLADRLGVNESAVSRDERNEYHGITLDRANRVLEALEAEVAIRVTTSVLPFDSDVVTK